VVWLNRFEFWLYAALAQAKRELKMNYAGYFRLCFKAAAFGGG
jgi:hypothetical protein